MHKVDVQNLIVIIIYHDFLPTPRRGSHVKSGKTQHTVIKIHPLAHILDSWVLIGKKCITQGFWLVQSGLDISYLFDRKYSEKAAAFKKIILNFFYLDQLYLTPKNIVLPCNAFILTNHSKSSCTAFIAGTWLIEEDLLQAKCEDDYYSCPTVGQVGKMMTIIALLLASLGRWWL